jgi:hypothetical protein
MSISTEQAVKSQKSAENRRIVQVSRAGRPSVRLDRGGQVDLPMKSVPGRSLLAPLSVQRGKSWTQHSSLLSLEAGD